MQTPQILVLVLTLVSLLLNAHLHGKDKDGKHSIWISLVNTSIWIGLLYWGGFFGKF